MLENKVVSFLAHLAETVSTKSNIDEWKQFFYYITKAEQNTDNNKKSHSQHFNLTVFISTEYCVRYVCRSVIQRNRYDDAIHSRSTTAAISAKHRWSFVLAELVVWGETSLIVASLLNGTQDGIIEMMLIDSGLLFGPPCRPIRIAARSSQACACTDSPFPQLLTSKAKHL